MPKNIFVDLNVILDVLLQRQGYESSRDVLRLGEQASYRLYISAHMVTTFAYLLEQANVPQPTIRKHVVWLLDTFSVVATDDQLLRKAAQSKLTDFEDAVVEQAASCVEAQVIVTRNIRDFKQSLVGAQTPEEYCNTTDKV